MTIKKYSPPPTVERFIASEAQYSMIVGPIGSGKTTGALAKILYHAGRQDRSPLDGKRRTRFLVIRNTNKELKDTTIKSFFMWFPPGVAGQWAATDKQFTFDFGDVYCEVLFRALDDPDSASSLLSLELTGVFFEEFVELPREIVDAAESRTDRYPQLEPYTIPAGSKAIIVSVPEGATKLRPVKDGAQAPRVRIKHRFGESVVSLPYGAAIEPGVALVAGATVTFTAPTEAVTTRTWCGVWGSSNAGTQDSWWFDWLYSPWGDDEDGAHKRASLAYFEQPSGFSPEAENLAFLGGAEFYAKKAVGKTVEWVRQFIECQWGFSQKGKPVYSAFKTALHVAATPLRYNPHVPLIMGFDAGLTPAAVFMQQDAFGRILVLRELVSDNMGAKRFCQDKIRPLLAREFPGCDLRIAADPATRQRAQTDERMVADIVEAVLGVKCQAARSNTLAARLGAVDDVLRRLTDAGPALLLDPSCRTLKVGFQSGYRYKMTRNNQRADEPDKNSYSHPHDALQYGVMYFESGAQREAKRKRAAGANIGYTNRYAAT